MRYYSLIGIPIITLLITACTLQPIAPEAAVKQNQVPTEQPTDSSQTNSELIKPQNVTDLESIYGPPSQAAFGSAAFYEQMKSETSLEQMALAQYKYFVGDLWERYGEEAWMGSWKEVYARPADVTHDIVAELRTISDPDAALSVPMILDNIDNAENARSALSAVYDNAATTEVRVFNLGDGGTMSGILVAGRRQATGEAILLVFLLD